MIKLKVNLSMFVQITANLVPLNSRRVAVKFDFFRIASLVGNIFQNINIPFLGKLVSICSIWLLSSLILNLVKL
jgi:hypothetical protein